MSGFDEFRHFHATPEWWEKLKPLAREMRHAPTPAENVMWHSIRNRRIGGAKFRRQYAIERFVVDFVCLEARLIVEVDGGIHEQQRDEDALRQSFLESLGFRIIRFTNDDVFDSLEVVMETIRRALSAVGPHP